MIVSSFFMFVGVHWPDVVIPTQVMSTFFRPMQMHTRFLLLQCSIRTAPYNSKPCVRKSSIKRDNRVFSASTSAKINRSASIFALSPV